MAECTRRVHINSILAESRLLDFGVLELSLFPPQRSRGKCAACFLREDPTWEEEGRDGVCMNEVMDMLSQSPVTC